MEELRAEYLAYYSQFIKKESEETELEIDENQKK